MSNRRPSPDSRPPKDRILTFYCPRDDKGDEVTLQWYADLMGAAERIGCMSFAFNLDSDFHDVLVKDDGVLRYAVFDKNPGTEFEDEIQRIKNTVMAPGANSRPKEIWRIFERRN